MRLELNPFEQWVSLYYRRRLYLTGEIRRNLNSITDSSKANRLISLQITPSKKLQQHRIRSGEYRKEHRRRRQKEKRDEES